jgi:hypothetical protein
MRRVGQIRKPDLGLDTDGLVGHLVRVPRKISFHADPQGCLDERDTILDWCDEQGIRLVILDMARDRNLFTGSFGLPEWEAFIEDDTQAVIFKTRWG